MAINDALALGDYIHLAAEEKRVQTQAARRSIEVMTVTSIDDGRIVVRPISEGADQRVATLRHVVCEVGDEVLVQRVASRWIVTGVISATMGGS